VRMLYIGQFALRLQRSPNRPAIPTDAGTDHHALCTPGFSYPRIAAAAMRAADPPASRRGRTHLSHRLGRFTFRHRGPSVRGRT
jgi:hypothetical protein